METNSTFWFGVAAAFVGILFVLFYHGMKAIADKKERGHGSYNKFGK